MMALTRRAVVAALGLPAFACANGAGNTGLSGDGLTDDTAALQREIDRIAKAGGILQLPAGSFRTTSPLFLRSGVSLSGVGRHVELTPAGFRFTGSWIVGPGIQLHSVQNCAVRNLGINCEQKKGSVAVSLGSDNNPSCKGHIFENIALFGADLGVRWGLANALNKLEQCDDISFRDIAFHSCADGFRFDAANGSDFSRIERVSMSNILGSAFDMRSAGFLTIENCAAGTIGDAVMFRISGGGPDPIRIIGCQNEPSGKFLTAEGINDQGIIILEGNVVNCPIEATGIRRFVSRANYINSTISLNGYLRWSSYDDILDPAVRHERQIIARGGAQYHAAMLKDARGLGGMFLLAGTRIEGADPAHSELVTREGIYCSPFAPTGTYAQGNYFKVAGAAYRVEKGGTAGPTFAGGLTGTVRVKKVGDAAVVASMSVTMSPK